MKHITTQCRSDTWRVRISEIAAEMRIGRAINRVRYGGNTTSSPYVII